MIQNSWGIYDFLAGDHSCGSYLELGGHILWTDAYRGHQEVCSKIPKCSVHLHCRSSRLVSHGLCRVSSETLAGQERVAVGSHCCSKGGWGMETSHWEQCFLSFGECIVLPFGEKRKAVMPLGTIHTTALTVPTHRGALCDFTLGIRDLNIFNSHPGREWCCLILPLFSLPPS